MRTSMKISDFEALIFDMDGLLLDSERLSLMTFFETCERFKLPKDAALFKQCIGTNSQAMERILKKGLNPKVKYEDFYNFWNDRYRALTENKKIPLKPCVTSFLEKVQALKIPMCIATSTKTDFAIAKLKKSNIFQYFEFIVGGDQVQRSKPHPDIYQRAVEKIGARSANSLALEDSENGVKSALAAGLTVVQIPDLVAPSDELRKMGHIIIDSLEEVYDYPF